MTPCHMVEITTPKQFRLRGLWLGPRRTKNAIIFLHGLGGSAFSMQPVIAKLAGKDTAVLAFSNRGAEKIIGIKRGIGKQSKRKKAGSAHEVFTECVDDIQGAINFARRQGCKNIFLAGHSTGCQKSIYWAYKKHGRGIKGIVLLAPVSDFAAEMKLQGPKKIARATKAAQALVRRGKKHALLPDGAWHEVLDAQRFLSLYSPDSVEEVFSYAQSKKNPQVLKSVGKPVLVLWAERDEFGGKEPLKKVRDWFEEHLRRGRVVVVPRVGHGFKGGEQKVAGEIRRFVEANH